MESGIAGLLVIYHTSQALDLYVAAISAILDVRYLIGRRRRGRKVTTRRHGQFTRLWYCTILSGLIGCPLIVGAHVALPFSGRVIDSDGRPVNQVLVSVTTNDDHGADIITVFTDAKGEFVMPEPVSGINFEKPAVTALKLGYEQFHQSVEFIGRNEAVFVTLIMRDNANQAEVAPASAWLSTMEQGKRAKLIQHCAGCHQMPAPAVRDYARLIDDNVSALIDMDPKQIRRQSWDMIQKYMNFLSAEDALQGMGKPPPDAFYKAPGSVVDSGTPNMAETLSEHFAGPMDHMEDYDYHAPLLATAKTAIHEYKVERPSRVSEALMAGSPPRLWVSGIGSVNSITRIDPETGERHMFDVPLGNFATKAPYTLQRGADGTLWAVGALNGVVAHFDLDKEEWINVWELKDEKGVPVPIHDLSYGHEHYVLADINGRIWFSSGVGNTVGYFEPLSGISELFPIPEVPRVAPGSYTGLNGPVMSSDRKRVWFCQAGFGAVGVIDAETHEIQTAFLQEGNAGPCSIAMSTEDVLYAPLFGTGQLLELDTRTGEHVVYDLPDRASAPTAATFDPIRKVVWIATANSDLIYRFDPRVREFAVLALPRRAAYLRMVAVDPVSGMLLTSYANRAEQVQGPRMVLAIDPGDGAYPTRAARQVNGEADEE
jgi:streptogramin lyase